MKINIEHDVTGCNDCPCLVRGRSFGNDGRDGSIVFQCNKGVFGGTDEFGYPKGKYKIPIVPPFDCPYFNSTPIARLTSELNKTEMQINEILKEANCALIDRK